MKRKIEIYKLISTKDTYISIYDKLDKLRNIYNNHNNGRINNNEDVNVYNTYTTIRQEVENIREYSNIQDIRISHNTDIRYDSYI